MGHDGLRAQPVEASVGSEGWPGEAEDRETGAAESERPSHDVAPPLFQGPGSNSRTGPGTSAHGSLGGLAASTAGLDTGVGAGEWVRAAAS